MVRVANSNKVIADNLLNYIEQDIKFINKALREQEDLETKFSAAHVASRNQVAIDKGNGLVKKIRWYMEVQLSETLQTAHDDAEIDAIDENIRTHEDGL